MIGVPSSAGARHTGLEGAPAALRAANLRRQIVEQGLEVDDLGDLPTSAFRPDPEHARQQNLSRVAEVVRTLRSRVEPALADGRTLLVLGGDCTVSLGVLAALVGRYPRLGLLYFDGDLDLNTPETTPSGILDGMVLAHALGRGAPQLAGIGPRVPLLSEEDVVLFGYDPDSGWIDPPELAALERSRMGRFPLSTVRADPVATARQALGLFDGRADAILVHFDVDVTNLPAADVQHPKGLETDAAFAALEVFTHSPVCAALVVTELNADRDADGRQAACLARGVANALGAGASPARQTR